MNNLEWMYRNDKSFRDFCQWTLKEHPFTFGMIFETREDAGKWLLADHVDDESCRQDADQPKRQESPDCESDSREKLEADVLVNFGDGLVRSIIMRLLERQAAITSKEWCWTNDSLQEQVDMLTEQRDRWHGNWTERNVEYNDLADEYDELKNKLETLKSYGVEIVDAVAGGYEVYNEAIRERDHYIELFHEQERRANELQSRDANIVREIGTLRAERDRYRELCGKLLDAADDMRRVRDAFDQFERGEA